MGSVALGTRVVLLRAPHASSNAGRQCRITRQKLARSLTKSREIKQDEMCIQLEVDVDVV
jgi:hypothetical protein